jgi:hypothetical protein
LQNLDLRSESIKERARGEALQQAFPTSRPQAIHGAATQGVAPAALRSNEMFSTAFDASQAARQRTSVEGHVAAPMVAAHDDRTGLGEHGPGGPRLPSRPIPPTPMPEPMAAFRPQHQDDDEVSYDDGTHLTLASEAGSQDTSEDDRFDPAPTPEPQIIYLGVIPSLDPPSLLPGLAFLWLLWLPLSNSRIDKGQKIGHSSPPSTFGSGVLKGLEGS